MNKKPFYDYFDNFDCDPADCSDNMSEQSDEYDAYYETTTTAPDDAETAIDYDSDDGYDNGRYDDAYGDKCDDAETANDDFVDPEIIIPSLDDETAATCDECSGTIWAQQKCALDDYEIISDVLGSEKQLVKLYSSALCESAEEPLRDIIRSNLVECAADQYSTFEYMQKHGMYPTEQAPEEKILQAKQQFSPLCHNDID